MRKYILGLTGILSIAFCLTFTSWKSNPSSVATKAPTLAERTDSIYVNHVSTLYNQVHLKDAGLSMQVFEKALTGFYNLKKSGKIAERDILTIADFDQLSSKKRLYIIDLDKKEMLLNTWVAHGQNSGDDETNHFSNIKDSFESSLGFYVTGEIYRGIHGKSLKLDGMDEGFNNNARNRSIVVHGAPYVSQGTINALGRLGRSQGCPAVAPEVAEQVINTIVDKTVLFVNKSTDNYHSKYLDQTLAADFATSDLTTQMD